MEACFLRCSQSHALFSKAFQPMRLGRAPNIINRRFCSSMGNHSVSRLRTEYSVQLKLEGGQSSVKRAYDALLLDAGGTLLQLAKPVEEIYAEIGRKYGLTSTPAQIKQGFKRVFSAPWPEKLRYLGDGRPFWKLVVSEATSCADSDYFEEVYKYYAEGDAWHLPEKAQETIILLKDAGVKVVVVSNFDMRLRKLLKDLNVLDLFDAVIISSEVGYEKPDERIFKAALEQVNVEAGKAIHVGDDEKADKDGANGVGIACWLWGSEVKTFSDIQSRILVPTS